MSNETPKEVTAEIESSLDESQIVVTPEQSNAFHALFPELPDADCAAMLRKNARVNEAERLVGMYRAGKSIPGFGTVKVVPNDTTGRAHFSWVPEGKTEETGFDMAFLRAVRRAIKIEAAVKIKSDAMACYQSKVDSLLKAPRTPDEE